MVDSANDVTRRMVYAGRRFYNGAVRWGFVDTAGGEDGGEAAPSGEGWFTGTAGRLMKPAPRIGAIYDIPVSPDGQTYRFGRAEYVATAGEDTLLLAGLVFSTSDMNRLNGWGEVKDRSDKALVARWEALDVQADAKKRAGSQANKDKVSQLDEMIAPLTEVLRSCSTSNDRSVMVARILDRLYRSMHD
jgi:hypothetical protein